jgi:hypothetical protein
MDVRGLRHLNGEFHVGSINLGFLAAFVGDSVRRKAIHNVAGFVVNVPVFHRFCQRGCRHRTLMDLCSAQMDVGCLLRYEWNKGGCFRQCCSHQERLQGQGRLHDDVMFDSSNCYRLTLRVPVPVDYQPVAVFLNAFLYNWWSNGRYNSTPGWVRV